MTGYFSERELIQSETATALKIDNTPNEDVKKSLAFTMAGLERLRACLGFPMKIHSGYRCAELNKAVHGSPNSQHMRGEAADFTCPAFGTPKDIATFLSGYMAILGIDQMIMEGTWVHVSFTHSPRHEVLTMRDGKYFNGVV